MQCPDFLANSMLGGWIGCNDPMVMTAQQQMDNMRSNFGPAANPQLVNTAVNDFGQYLQDTGYNQQISNLQQLDATNTVSGWLSGGLSGMMPALIAIGVIGVVALGAGGPRREVE